MTTLSRWVPSEVRLRRVWKHGDLGFVALSGLASLAVLGLVLAIGVELWNNSALARQAFGIRFLYTNTWDPAIQRMFGALPFISGTLVTSFVALLIAVPLGVGVAVFLSELAPRWLGRPLGFLVELLAAVPSVIYGLWGLFAFIPGVVRPFAHGLNGALGFLPLFAGPVLGPSRLAASLVLAIMILPTISATSRDVLRAIPDAQREAALSLGSTRWEMIWRVLIPYGWSGLLGAIILGLGRALGETIAVTMVIGNNLDASPSLLHPGYTMSSIIANEFAEATYDLYLHALIEIGLVLFFLTMLLNLAARLLIWRVQREPRAATPSESAISPATVSAGPDRRLAVQRLASSSRARESSLRLRVRKAFSALMMGVAGLATVTAVLPLLWILFYVVRQGAPALSWDFITHLPTPVGVPGGGIANALVGSAITVGVGLLLAAPVGVLAAIYVARRANTPLGLAVRFGSDLIAGVPSIVMGIFAYTIIVLPQRHFSAFAGGAALAFIMLPIIIRTAEEMFKLVPESLREGSLALGAPEWWTTVSVLLPAAADGILTGALLAVARAAGEAAPMLFTAFGNPFMNLSLGQPIATLPHTIFVYAISPYEDWRTKAWATALVLIALVLGLNVGARSIAAWRARRLGAPTRRAGPAVPIGGNT